MPDIEDNDNIFERIINNIIQFHAYIEPALRMATMAWAFSLTSILYIIIIAFYCNDREIPFFDFAATTGVYIWIVGALVVFFSAILSVYSLAPVFMKVAILKRVQISNATAIGLTLAPAVIAISIIFMRTLFLKDREFIFAATIIVATSIFTCIVCFYRYLTAPLVEGATSRAGDAVLAANLFVVPVFMLVSKLSLMGIHHLESSEGLQNIDFSSYAWIIYAASFLVIPIIVVVFFNAAPGLKTRKGIFLFGALAIVAPLMLAPFAIFDRVLTFLSVGGDVPFAFSLQKGENVWGQQEVRGYMRFITTDNVHISCGKGTPVATLNLRHVTGIRRILDGEDVNCSAIYPAGQKNRADAQSP
ncbi:hypothetical protein [Magnetospirillum sulfuroxidans]|uniref:Uncharacterized protein n=1 Tax=Magnetospirillum sulfuroxidans TaxID=611300 RepID=A0ABS5I964_9PROT|nr:hypothetical protein [Magnetospirillum sulfuroxidans]MBR9970956.1 hypothetical protein [Magnetospirillum sulfuroxidans]